MDDLEKLKFNLQELNFPYFSQQELQNMLLEYGNVKRASYEGCMIKAQDDSVSLGPINTVSNGKYWLTRARQFRATRTGGIRRADEV